MAKRKYVYSNNEILDDATDRVIARGMGIVAAKGIIEELNAVSSTSGVLTKLEQFTMAAMQGLLAGDVEYALGEGRVVDYAVSHAKATLAKLAETDT